MTEALTRGRVCPQCKLNAAADDLFCVCGYEFTDKDQIVDLTQANASAPAAATTGSGAPPVTPPVVAPADQQQATVVASGAADTTAAVSSQPVTPQPAQAQQPDVPPVVSTAPSSGSAKIAWIDLKFDLGYRKGRPDDATPPADISERMFSLTGKVIPFGRLSPIIPLDDEYCSRQHGNFYRRPDGGYDIENWSEGGTRVNGVLKEKKDGRVPLKDGDRIELGAYTVFEYHEQ